MEDISKELLFVRTLEKVRQIAREQGNYIREEQVKGEFADLDLSDHQLQMVFEYLAKYGIVDENAGEEVTFEKEEILTTGSLKQDWNPEENGNFRQEISMAADQAGLIEDLTEEEKDYLQIYLDEIAALPVHEKEELEADAIAVMEGDAKAQKRLMESFLKDVADIAKLYVGQGVLLEDLIGEGNMALAMGLQMLGSRERKSTLKSFSEVQSELAKQVMDAMEALVRENAASEKADQKVAERVNLVADQARALAEELRRKVTPEELAREAGLSIKVIQDAIRMSGYKIEDIVMT